MILMRLLNPFSVTTRIVTMSAVLIGLMALSLIYINVKTSGVTQVISNHDQTLDRLKSANDIVYNFSEMKFWLSDLAISGAFESEKNANDAKGRLGSLLDALQKSDAELINKIRPQIDSYFKTMMEASDVFLEDKATEGNELVSKARSLAKEVNGELALMLSNASEKARRDGESVVGANMRMRDASLYILIAATLLGVVLSWVFSRSIIIPLMGLVKGVTHVGASGDLSYRVSSKGRDEIAILSRSINEMLQKLQYSYEILRGNIELMEVLGSAIAKRDSDTNIHNYRVTIYAIRLAEKVGLSQDEIRNIICGAFLHDVGKIGISDSILLKPGKLTEEEFEIMKAHVHMGLDIIQKSEWLKNARDVVEYHHEKFNGKGYLKGLAGTNIPISARIFAIVDVFDALTSKRPYKEPMSFEKAMSIIRQDCGSHFDREIFESFETIANDLYESVSKSSDDTVVTNLAKLVEKHFLGASDISYPNFQK